MIFSFKQKYRKQNKPHFMRAYAACFRPQNIEFHSIWQKKHPNSCICAFFVVPLRPIIMLKYCTIAESIIQNYENSPTDCFNPCVQ